MYWTEARKQYFKNFWKNAAFLVDSMSRALLSSAWKTPRVLSCAFGAGVMTAKRLRDSRRGPPSQPLTHFIEGGPKSVPDSVSTPQTLHETIAVLPLST